MLFKIIICLLITYRVECKAWPDQSNRYDYYDPAHSWGNPYYGPGDIFFVNKFNILYLW